VSLSSTAITLKFLQEKGLVSSSYGRFVVAVLIFQDMAAIPMMLITPLLAGSGESTDLSVLRSLVEGVVLVMAVFAAAVFVVPRVLHLVAKTRNYQLFLLFILLICFATAWLTSAAGLSLALGAFLAGLMISESEYSDHAVGHILPFQQVFSSFFFVSVGMLLDLNFVASNFAVVATSTGTMLLVKFLIAGGVARLLGYPLRAAILSGLALCQVGEFAFILLREGMAVQIISDYTYQVLLALSLITMLLSPFLMMLGPRIANSVFRLPLPAWVMGHESATSSQSEAVPDNHVVIIGFGVCGRNLAWASKLAGVPYSIVELNPETVRSERKNGEPIIFGDATHKAILERVHVPTAQVVVIAIDDPTATRAIVEAVRAVSPEVYILVRTRYLKEIEPMVALGADDVVPEEFESSVEIFSRVLTKYLIPTDEIQRFCTEARARKYQIFRSMRDKRASLSDLSLNLPDLKVEALRIAEDSALVGQSLVEAELRPRYNLTVLMIRRAEQDVSNPLPGTRIETGDILVLFGEVENLSRLQSDLAGPITED
jgi:CPA2 family monovalent cation:H+ antiporter-2